MLELKARSNDAERAAKELKANGHGDEAQAKLEESGRLWKEAEELRRKLDSIRGQKTDRPAGGPGDGQAVEIKTMLERLRASVAEQRALAEKEAATGNETAALQAKQRAEQSMLRIGELEAKLRAIHVGGDARHGGPHDGGDAVAMLTRQLEELMRRLNEMQKTLSALERRVEAQAK